MPGYLPRADVAPYVVEQVLQARDRSEPYAPPVQLVERCWLRERSWILDVAQAAGVELSSALLTPYTIFETMAEEARKYGLTLSPLELQKDAVLLHHPDCDVGLPVGCFVLADRKQNGNEQLAGLRRRVKWCAPYILARADALLARRPAA